MSQQLYLFSNILDVIQSMHSIFQNLHYFIRGRSGAEISRSNFCRYFLATPVPLGQKHNYKLIIVAHVTMMPAHNRIHYP